MRVIPIIISLLLLTVTYATIAQPSLTDSINHDSSIMELSVYKISPPLEPTDIPNTIEIVGGSPGQYHHIIGSSQTVEQFISKGYIVEYQEDETASLTPSFAEEYHTLKETTDFLNSTSENYAEITNLFSIGQTYENREIYCIEISDNPGVDEDEPGVLFMGLHHAREWPTLEICLYIIKMLTEKYQSNDTITSLVDNRRIWIIPCVNPDGYYYSHDLNQDFRKNRHFLEEYNTYGIDLNRNYGGSTNGNPEGMWGSSGMSHNPYAETYCGEMPFSEKETVAVKEFFLSQDICTSISWHTYSELVMWPWGYSLDQVTPDNDYISQVGFEIASRITKQTYSGSYTPTQSAGLYPTTGDTTDWMYGYSHYVLGKPHFPFTIEACASFHPTPNALPQIVEENFDGALYLLQEAENIDALQPRVLPPVITEIDTTIGQPVHIEWDVINPESYPENFEIREYDTLHIEVDDTNDIDRYWQSEGFIPATRYAYSCDTSYFPYPESNKISSLTSLHPVPVKRGMNLSFYTIYQIENNNDQASIEISTDGRNYQVLDTFTGFTTNWEKKEYSLEEYIGKSIYIQFRYSTDAGILENGFYIDDIYPVARYDSITSLGNSFSDSADVPPSSTMDSKFYQVRGYNEIFGWGDWSTLMPINESFFFGNPPQAPVITGPVEVIKGETTTYELTGNDPDGDSVSYYIKWGDGTTCTDWLGPYPSNQTVSFDHTWESTGTFTIEVQTMDETGLLSEWSQLDVTLTKSKVFRSPFIQILIDLFQWMEMMFIGS